MSPTSLKQEAVAGTPSAHRRRVRDDVVPSPAIVVTTPVAASTRRMRLLPPSSLNTLPPSGATASARGSSRHAAVALEHPEHAGGVDRDAGRGRACAFRPDAFLVAAAVGAGTMLKPHDEVIGKTHDDGAPVRPRRPPSLYPQVEHVVEVEVGQERADAPALDGPGLGVGSLPFLQHARPQPFLDEAHDAPVRHTMLDRLHQPPVVERVEEARRATSNNDNDQRPQCPMAVLLRCGTAWIVTKLAIPRRSMSLWRRQPAATDSNYGTWDAVVRAMGRRSGTGGDAARPTK